MNVTQNVINGQVLDSTEEAIQIIDDELNTKSDE